MVKFTWAVKIFYIIFEKKKIDKRLLENERDNIKIWEIIVINHPPIRSFVTMNVNSFGNYIDYFHSLQMLCLLIENYRIVDK